MLVFAGLLAYHACVTHTQTLYYIAGEFVSLAGLRGALLAVGSGLPAPVVIGVRRCC
ncbi:MAG TPA: hypothetical protein VKQ36_08075 [Ktedonobacterales bacterium]|nr:hypothetical protein [Ktedonobacterales bacterium]